LSGGRRLFSSGTGFLIEPNEFSLFVLNALEHGEKGKKRVTPNWDAELAYILAGDGADVPVTVICDVYAESIKTGKRYSFEVKAPLPNSDQTKVSKQKIFKLYSMQPRLIDEAYYALPHNPFGKREKYSWSFPARWFDMRKDKVVLIGDEFWELMGGLGTYQAFIAAINELGKHYRDRIYREYLMIEPPPDAEVQGKL
jgi:Type II restriction endonuclease, TdeIII